MSKSNRGTGWGILAGPLLALVSIAPTNAQEEKVGPTLLGGVAAIDVGGRVQTQFNTTSVDSEPGTLIFLRRVRLELDVKVNDRLSGRVHPDFAGDRVRVKDAFLKYTVSPGLEVLAGNAKRPFSLLELVSSTSILPIERGAEIRGIAAWDQYELVKELGYSDRDVGVQVMGQPAAAPLGLGYAVGYFQGPLGEGVAGESTRQVAARLTITPVPDVTFGAAWSSRDFVSAAAGGGGLERGSAFELDLEYGSFDQGLHLLAEITTGDFDPSVDTDFIGAQAWLGYRFHPGGEHLSDVEPIFRISRGDVDERPDLGGTLFSPGLNLYLSGRNRVMFNYDVWSPEAGEGTERSFKTQFQLAF